MANLVADDARPPRGLEGAEAAFADALHSHTTSLAERESTIVQVVADGALATTSALERAESAFAEALQNHTASVAEREAAIAAVWRGTMATSAAIEAAEADLARAFERHAAVLGGSREHPDGHWVPDYNCCSRWTSQAAETAFAQPSNSRRQSRRARGRRGRGS